MSANPANSNFHSGSATQELSFDREEVIKHAKTDLNFLAAIALPTIFTHKFPTVLLAVWSILLQNVGIDAFFRLALGIPRGHAKTTLIKLFVLYCILFTDRKFILIICATEPLAVNFLADVCSMLDQPNIRKIFGDWNIGKTEDNKQQKKFSFAGRDIVLVATGQGSVRGININNDRPELIIMDDAQTKENSQSEAESLALLDWIQSTVMKLRSPRRCMYIYIGNMYRVTGKAVCILAKLKDNPMWVSFITGAILVDGNPLWPELHSLTSLMDEFENDYNMGTPEVFLAELMNDVDNTIGALFDLTKIPLNPYEDVKHECTGRFVLIDVATDKIGADDTTIGGHGIYDGKPVLEELKFGSYSPKETIQAALEMCFQTGANVVGVEAVAYQHSLLFWFAEVCAELGITGIDFVPVMPTGTKNGRILSWFRRLLASDCFIAWAVRSHIIKQARDFKPGTKNNRDDILDMAAYEEQMMQKYGHMIQLPYTLAMQDGFAVGVEEDNSPF